MSDPIKALLHTRDARGRLAEVKTARLVEALGGDVIEVPLAAVLGSKLDAVGSDQAARQALRASFVERDALITQQP